MEHLIGIELAYINTNHPDFVGGAAVVSDWMQKEVNDCNWTYHKYKLDDLVIRLHKNENTNHNRVNQRFFLYSLFVF